MSLQCADAFLGSVSGVLLTDSSWLRGVHVSFKQNGHSSEPRSLVALASQGCKRKQRQN